MSSSPATIPAVGTPPLHQLPFLKVPDFRGRRLVVVIRAIEIPYRRVNEFVDIHAVQAIDPNCIKFAAQCWTLSPAEGTDSALSAKYVVNVVGLVIDEVRLT
jgi:hypothetical protein